MPGTMERADVSVSKMAKNEREWTVMLAERYIQSKELSLQFRAECGWGK